MISSVFSLSGRRQEATVNLKKKENVKLDNCGKYNELSP